MRTLDWQAIAEGALHPLQVRILETLAREGSPRSPLELAQEFGERLGNVSYHVRALDEAGLVRCTRTRPRRGAVQHFYALTRKAVRR